MNSEQLEETLADLGYIAKYATTIREQLERGEQPVLGYVARLAELGEKVERKLNEGKVC